MSPSLARTSMNEFRSSIDNDQLPNHLQVNWWLLFGGIALVIAMTIFAIDAIDTKFLPQLKFKRESKVVVLDDSARFTVKDKSLTVNTLPLSNEVSIPYPVTMNIMPIVIGACLSLIGIITRMHIDDGAQQPRKGMMLRFHAMLVIASGILAGDQIFFQHFGTPIIPKSLILTNHTTNNINENLDSLRDDFRTNVRLGNASLRSVDSLLDLHFKAGIIVTRLRNVRRSKSIASSNEIIPLLNSLRSLTDDRTRTLLDRTSEIREHTAEIKNKLDRDAGD